MKPQTPEPARIMLVDDHPMLRRGLADLLAMEGDLLPVAQASSGAEAVKIATTIDPELDLILLDLNMPGLNGIETTQALRNAGVAAKIIIFSVSDEHADVVEALRQGADGYLLKDMEPEDFVQQVRAAVKGKTALSPELTQILASAIKGRLEPVSKPIDLTRREKDVLELIAKGQSNKLIARNLDISEGTVKVHVKRVLHKLGLNSRTEAAIWALENNLA
ncbi:MAG: two-component system response regulator NarL [Thiopseudomonas sp.]|nr:two-component system response regulator NarL [Thiopseudomonas sp.]